MHIEKSCDCGRNRADRYVRAGVSQRTAPAMIFRTGGSETGVVPKQSGTLLAMTIGTLKDTPALDALKASCGAPISMGRGEIPVRLAATSRLFCLRVFIWMNNRSIPQRTTGASFHPVMPDEKFLH